MTLIPNAAKIWLKLHSIQVAAVFAILGMAWLGLAPVRALIPFGTIMSIMVVGFILVIVVRLLPQKNLTTLGAAVIDVTEDVYSEGKTQVNKYLTPAPAVAAKLPTTGYIAPARSPSDSATPNLPVTGDAP